MREYYVPKEFEGYRLDMFLGKKLPSMSRSLIQKLVKSEKITVNGKISTKVSQTMIHNSIVTIDIPAPKVNEYLAEDIK